MDTQKGSPYPLGATLKKVKNQWGVNFALFSAQARAVELCLFDRFDHELRFSVLEKTNDIFHIWIPGVPVGTKYGYRIYGRHDYVVNFERTLSNSNKLMLDPYAKAVVGKPDLSTIEAQSWFVLNDERDNAKLVPKSVVVDGTFKWGRDNHPRTPWSKTVIYELHVKGFTQLQQNLPKRIRGTYKGLAHSATIDYLKSLGITAVELQPINYMLDEQHLQEKGLVNYWGYNPLAMFAVEPRYAATDDPLNEFKTMVKTLHKAGIEVILDVVFNHTAESEKFHSTFSQRGIDDSYYYWHDAEGCYLNWTGCGNMLNLSLPQTRRWVIDCLKYWVEECHVDGFRFDLAPALGRDSPAFNPNAALFSEIFDEPSLHQTKFIAEPWDIGVEGYQLGNFPPFFSEWNDRYRDEVTRFWLWKSGDVGALASRIAGSSDIFKKSKRLPHNSVNFITAHDGFTLRDLVSYNYKHNEANGEHNRDGRDVNYSYNHGYEGRVDHLFGSERKTIENHRYLSSGALLCSLLLSNGTPMLLAGDEIGHSQDGNNNAYCQDNKTTWIDWSKQDVRLLNLVREVIALRKHIRSLQSDAWWTDENVQWLNDSGQAMAAVDWHNQGRKSLQIMLDEKWLFLINGKAELQVFRLPPGKWQVRAGNYLEKSQGKLVMSDLGFCVLSRH
ncbi:glycogen debranching enzyme [Actinobacillus succinogenes]|uniref:Glycogen debranching enzyme GlgX n=1 Tax=Actinobacillus succinogenes (strain ATCC 55618 / DSM 22257 / CCUG 43843 / 130Z) TaxID=339671 RepID=A6VP16_ACTSZ|nr:glycogen debranching protein GlgX [Actinobacillus succinogenes]ABR74713.1 glycogen debranching enzyme GlgX [Actinobacillus succinogenes 130Z]PHI40867.1 glycogen debranching enzyme [Actinobacillus succinogenes]